MNEQRKVGEGLAIVAAVIVAIVVIVSRSEEAEPIQPVASEPESTRATAEMTLDREDERQPVAPTEAREEKGAEEFFDDEEWIWDEEVEPLPPLRGRAVDLAGFGVAGVPVVMVPFGRGPKGIEPVLTDGEGWFVLEEPHSSGVIDAVGDTWTTLFQPRLLEPNPAAPPILVVAPAIAIGGMVRNEEGAPVAGVRIRILLADDLRAGLDVSLEESHTKELAVLTDEGGSFALDAIPGVRDLSLEAKRAGYRRHRRPLPATSDLDLAITLLAQPARLGVLCGRVVGEGEEPVDEAWVSLGGAVARADDGGYFEVHLNDEGDRVLRAVASGYRPLARPARPGLPLAEAFSDPLLLVLDDSMLSIVVEVRHPDGSPAEGISVWTLDTTPFGLIPVDPARHDWRVERTVEEMVGGQFFDLDGEWGNREPGRYELRGLLDHPYTVCAFDPASLALVWSPPLSPRSDRMAYEPQAVLRLPSPDPHPLVAGTVRSLAGRPVVGAEVRFSRFVTVPSGRGGGDVTEVRHGEPILTDAAGRFSSENVSRDAIRLDIKGGGLAKAISEEIDSLADLTALELRGALRCRLQVVYAGGAKPDSLQLRDEHDEPLGFSIKRGWVESGGRHAELVNGRSEIIKTSERARTLVLFRDREEVLRVPLALTPGERNVIRL